MPERLKYKHLFDRNPFEGQDPRKVFSLLHWGNTSRYATEIDAPEPLVMLGLAAQLIGSDSTRFTFRKGEAFLAVGCNSNELYIIPRKRNKPLSIVPPFSTRAAENVGYIQQTDYWACKGGDTEHYYYHKHEKPYPGLWLNDAAGVGYLRAANHKGKPSYAVGKEGIVG